MGRRYHRHFLARRETRRIDLNAWQPDQGANWQDMEYLIAACGQETRADWNGNRYEEREDWVTCPSCNKKLFTQKLRERGADAPALTVVQDKEAKGHFRYQQGWRAVVDGEHVAYLGYEDHAWRVYRLRIDEGQVAVGAPLAEDGAEISRDRNWRPYGAKAHKSKEAALLAVGDLRAAGKLPTFAELIAARDAYLAEAHAAEQARRTVYAEREQKRNETLEALNEILAKESLSNFQRQGLMTAIARFEKPSSRYLDDED